MESFLKSLPENFELHEFKLERVLGQGGFGITYLALDTNLMQHVAIKEYFPREFSSRDSTFTIHAVGNAEDKDTFSWGLKRFLAEARVLAQLSHPNIVSIKRFFEAHGTAYLVMEYCDGKPLDEIIRDRGPLNESQLNEILFPLLDGLEHVHGKAFLHRDVKPANIFIRRDGTPVLLDFGAAKHEMPSQSKSVTSLATAGYAPFEQYSTKGRQGAWSDIYGLAATIYRAISGVKPQDAPDRMLEDSLVPAVELLNGKFPISLLTALDKALAIRPQARPQTIGEFRKLIEAQPVQAVVYAEQKTEGLIAPVNPELRVVTQSQSSEFEKISFRAAQINGKSSEQNWTKNNYLIIFSLLVVLLGGAWFFFPTSERNTQVKVDASLQSEVQVAEKITSVVVEETPVVPEVSKLPAKQPLVVSKSVVVEETPVVPEVSKLPAKQPLVVSKSLEEKTNLLPPKLVVSFEDIDRAIQAGQYANAQALIKEVIRNHPDNAGAYFRMGQIFASEDKYPEAKEQLNKANKLDPSLRFTSPGKFQELYNEILAMEKMSKLPVRD